ncbi:hypothetical protein P175DRAFT_0426222 [Aspergillus ochraceoroseus IBT 24754]|uniref:Uncharacterized protein n=2 Tax=Aspergillus ochraceoroseus TaxID=138278 RepID=A0A2T5M9Q9_9EURO|nr:uncharacterized protein P175DRAFT_0426222 [Aspergillus ochraceoroseus IBT 24754]KKK16899.1 hypothetical protein AOCH_007087 [Aspergillus ochraceoroseus]PTU25269.1 hypothetical protein P175DRAFT_0426222 [Aspergillus ochraceoroseus IBT 24754]
MFRRKRSASQHHHPLSTYSTQSAQSAATHAFLKSKPSSSSLSSAAAAAALRSSTPTPISVENVQTKRMLQRQASVSSQLGRSPSSRPASRNSLRRANSSGSMSARTFRDQSPRRPSSSYAPAAVAPPLPLIPPKFASRRSQTRRSVSLGPEIWLSQSAVHGTERAIGAGQGIDEPGSPQSVHGFGRDTASPEHQRSGSRNSINFSYPMNSRTNSPTLPPGVSDRRDSAIVATRTGHTPSPNIPPSKDSVAQSNPKSTRQPSRGTTPGSPGRSPRPVGTAVLAAQVASRHDEPNTSPATSPRGVRYRDQTAFERSPSQSPASVDRRSRHTQSLVKRPSTVVENRQAEENQELKSPREHEEHVPIMKSFPEEPPRAKTPPILEGPPELLQTPPVSPSESNLSVDLDQPAHLRHSNSPGRMTRFSTQLSVMNFAGEHLHQPPARSVSPAKSALKNPRKSSLSPDGRIYGILRPGPPLSEISDATSVASDDGARPNYRRRPVKVSFDDEAEVVGIAASPPTSPEDVVPEPPSGKSKEKAAWFGLDKRKSHPLRSVEVDEFDGVLKPCPALPSFGSIRGGRDSAQREIIHRDLSDNESTASSELNMGVPSWSFSSDHTLGNIIPRATPDGLQQQQQQDRVDNTQPPAHAEPIFLTEAYVESQKENIPVGKPALQALHVHKTLESSSLEVRSEQHHVLPSNSNLAVPNIMVQPATPQLEKGRLSLEIYDVPGGFPRSSIDFESQKNNGRRPYGSTKGDSTAGVDHGDSDDESSESIYSDAEEDLKGDGFGSINAILGPETAPPQSAESEHEFAAHPPAEIEAKKLEQKAPGSEIPETCRIAQVVTPVPRVSSPPAPNSPDSSDEPLPFSSPYPPFPIRPRAKKNSQGMPRSSTMPVNSTKGPMAVEIHTIAKVRDPAQFQGRNPQSSRAEADASQLPQGPGQNKERPASWAGALRNGGSYPTGGEQDMDTRSARKPRRQLSNGSDSSSSFKRSARPAKGDGMRWTLRGGQPSNRTSASPTETRTFSSGMGGAGTGNMRSTLRGSVHRRDKSSFFSTGKSPKGKFAKDTRIPFTSRFPDSESDSDGGGFQARRLHRRKNTMSDDDMRPVRGIPRRRGAHDGDSTELEDSSDGERHISARPRADARQPNRTGTVRDPALAAVAKSRGMTEEELEDLLKRGSPRKPGLLHRFSMKKSKPPGERGKLQFDESQSGTIPEQHAVMDGTYGTSVRKASMPADSHRLLKKTSQKSSGGDTWPLRSDRGNAATGASTAAPASHQPPRPQTSDGVAINGNDKAGAAPPAFEHPGTPQSPLSADQSPANDSGNYASEVTIEASGRKKRFQRFRKAFNLRG